jgi:uncharacterized protein YbjT (DUF2867 family)
MTLLLLYLAYSLAIHLALSRRGVISGAAPPGPRGAGAISRVLVIGASGGTGRALVRQALERQYAVTAFVRDPRRLGIAHANLTVVRGDVLDYSSVAEAVRGQDAVVCALGHKRFLYPTRILSAGTRNVLRAMDAHGVRRLICQTSLGIGDSAGRMGLYYTLVVLPLILPFYFWDKTRQERLVADSGAAWTIVRPTALTNAAGRGECRHGAGVGSRLWTLSIPRADVASFMLDQLSEERYLGVAVGLTS